jgi:bifunctional oligoribonuclease and PAP phosphatase NrnA
MHYKESKQILEKIRQAKKIALICHASPDPDSIGSNIALALVLKKLGKNNTTIFSADKAGDKLDFIYKYKKLTYDHPSDVDLSKFDLLISLDSQQPKVLDNKLVDVKFPADLNVVVIDHHANNTKFGEINLLDGKAAAVSEMLFLIFEDWNVSIDKKVATCLITGIVGDTGAFRFPNTSPRVLEITSKLMQYGANKEEVVFNLYFSVNPILMKFWGEALRNMQIDHDHRFAWVAIPYNVFCELGGPSEATGSTASNFFQSVDGTDFGVVIVEKEPGVITASLRSRTGYDVSKIGAELGGGGHRYAGGGKFRAEFNEGVSKVLEAVKRHAKQNEKSSS